MYSSTKDVVGKPANLKSLIEAIINGRWQEMVEAHRAGVKSDFPAFVSTGTFSHRKKEGNQTYTGVCILDFDKMDDAHSALHQMAEDPYVLFAFRSRGGKGLAVGISHQYGAAAHSMVVEDAMQYFYGKYNFEPDTQCKDICRLRYVSFDPEGFFDEGAQPYTLQMQEQEEARETGMGAPYSPQENCTYAAKKLEEKGVFFNEGNKHFFRLRLASWVNRMGVPQHELESFLRMNYPSDNPTNAVAWVYSKQKHDHGSRVPRRRVRGPREYVSKHTQIERSSNQSQANTVSGPAIYRLRDEKDVYFKFRKKGLPEIPGLGFSQMFDKHLKVIPGMFTVVIASSNTGKTTFLLNKMIYMACKFGWKFALFTPEQDAPSEIMGERVPLKAFVIDAMISILVGRPVSEVKHFKLNGFGEGKPVMPMTDSQYEAAFNFIDEHFIFLNPDSGDAAFASILGLGEYCVEKYGVNGIVVDPWNMVEDSLGDYTEAADKFRQITQFRKRTGVGWWISNHVSKSGVGLKSAIGDDGLSRKMESVPTLYDAKGGTEWNDMADYGIVLFRPKGEPETTVKVDKIRFTPLCGEVGELKLILNRANGRFYEPGLPTWEPLINLEKWI